VTIGSSGHQMNVGLWINLAVGCVPPPIGMSQADPRRDNLATSRGEDRREPTFDTSWPCGHHGASPVKDDPMPTRAWRV
jgi:hypothetical protein